MLFDGVTKAVKSFLMYILIKDAKGDEDGKKVLDEDKMEEEIKGKIAKLKEYAWS